MMIPRGTHSDLNSTLVENVVPENTKLRLAYSMLIRAFTSRLKLVAVFYPQMSFSIGFRCHVSGLSRFDISLDCANQIVLLPIIW